MCAGIENDVLEAKDGANMMVDLVYKRDPLSVTSVVYQKVQKLIETLCSAGETYGNLEARFASQLSKFNAFGSSVQMSEAMAALKILGNSNIDCAAH